MSEVLLDTLIDLLKLIPFLFLTYLLMEVMEHMTSDHVKLAVRRAGYAGPAVGGLLGAFPQCGFSAAAASLYSGKLITMGTLLAVFLSTSDEMLPIFLSERVNIWLILKVIGLKVLIGIVAGFLVDVLFRSREHMKEPGAIHSMCEQEHCRCEKSIWKSAMLHTVKVLIAIAVVSFALNCLIFWMGEDTLAGFVQNQPVLGPILAGIVGLLPNCAASVVITQLYLEGILSVGAMMSGLLVGAGVGIIILIRMNKNWKDNLRIIGLLYGIGVVSGIMIEFIERLI